MRVYVQRSSLVVAASVTIPLPPVDGDPGGPTNAQRAQWIETALHIFTLYTGQNLELEPDDVVADFLADLMHWCDAHEIDFEAAREMGAFHHEDEVNEA